MTWRWVSAVRSSRNIYLGVFTLLTALFFWIHHYSWQNGYTALSNTRTRKVLDNPIGKEHITPINDNIDSISSLEEQMNIANDETLPFDNKLVDIEPTTSDSYSSSTKPINPSTFPSLQLPSQYQQYPAKPTPLCFVSTWSASDLPLYALSMFETVQNNKDYVKLVLFYDQIANLPPKEQYDNIDYVQIPQLDSSYIKGGFPRFLSDQLCKIYNIKSRSSKECRQLFNAVKLASYRSEAKYLVQLRGMYGRIFEPFINAHYCDAWAWIDLDALLGNVRGWLDNDLVWSTNIFTISGLDWGNIYSRGQFTAHNQKMDANKANNAWKKCLHLSSPANLINAFNKGSNCIDEGCYSEGILESQLVFGIFPWQGNDWDQRDTRYYLYDQDRLWGVKNCKSKEECRKKIFKKTIHLPTKELNRERSVLSGSFITSEQVKQLHKGTSEISDRIYQKKYEIGRGNCMWWIPRSFANCVKQAKLPDIASNHILPWAILVHPERKMQLVYWKLGQAEKNLASHSDARELLLAHFQNWKRKDRFQFDNITKEDLKHRPISIEVTLLP